MYNLMLGDCLERMKEIPDGSVDMVLCDLPYGLTRNRWDSVIPFEPLWTEYKRIIKKNGAVVLFGNEPFSSCLRISNLKWYKYDWVWNKKQVTGFLNAKKQPLRTVENILVFYDHQCTYNPQMEKGKMQLKATGGASSNYNNFVAMPHYSDTYYPKNIITIPQKRVKGGHPTQKPVALLEYLIKTYTNEGDTVLDNCAGSMSTVIACLNTSRNCIAIEKDENYFNIGCERVKNHILENNMNLCYSQVYGGDVICQDL